ncbi:hypothetical protein CVT24_002259 [Panaeolus cyanescens]|uniref:Uncharacterized protein n=1 Tax=Panaeolus cyanescens TaxID=181874 RepID=A0A409WXG8_9AGAR|nr:hypothetical protein CVT24_002259 [Panaeolus cyanescens]
MWTPSQHSLAQNQVLSAYLTESCIRSILKYSKDDYDKVLGLLGTNSDLFLDEFDFLPLCEVEDDEDRVEVDIGAFEHGYLEDETVNNRLILRGYENQYYIPGYPASQLVAASTAPLPILAPVDPTAHSNPLSVDETPPYIIYSIPIVLFSVMLITAVVLTIRYRRIKRPRRRLILEPPRMDPEKMGTLRSTPLGIFMPQEDPFTKYSNDSSASVEPSRPVPVFMPSEGSQSHPRRSTIRQGRSHTYTMSGTRKPKRRPKVPKAQSASSIGTITSLASSMERIRPPIPAVHISSRSGSRRSTIQEFNEGQSHDLTEDDKPPAALLPDTEFGEDIPLNTPQQPDGPKAKTTRLPRTPAPQEQFQQEFWEKAN